MIKNLSTTLSIDELNRLEALSNDPDITIYDYLNYLKEIKEKTKQKCNFKTCISYLKSIETKQLKFIDESLKIKFSFVNDDKFLLLVNKKIAFLSTLSKRHNYYFNIWQLQFNYLKQFISFYPVKSITEKSIKNFNIFFKSITNGMSQYLFNFNFKMLFESFTVQERNSFIEFLIKNKKQSYIKSIIKHNSLLFSILLKNKNNKYKEFCSTFDPLNFRNNTTIISFSFIDKYNKYNFDNFDKKFKYLLTNENIDVQQHTHYFSTISNIIKFFEDELIYLNKIQSSSNKIKSFNKHIEFLKLFKAQQELIFLKENTQKVYNNSKLKNNKI